MLSLTLEPFTAELSHIADAAMMKLAFQAKTPVMKAKVKAEKHFASSDPNWNEFEKNLKLKSFQQVVAGHPQADKKLKTYVENFGGYLLSKQVTAQVPSSTTKKTYTIKELPGGRLGCNCGNWQYRKSVDGGDCKHIQSLVGNGMKKLSFAERVKLAFMSSLSTVAAGASNVGVNRLRATKSKNRALASREASRQYANPGVQEP